MDIVTILLGISSAVSVVLGVLAQLQKNKTDAANTLIDNLQESANDCYEDLRVARKDIRDLEAEARDLLKTQWIAAHPGLERPKSDDSQRKE